MATYGRVRSTRLLLVGLLVASLVTITVDARGGDTGPLAVAGRVFGSIVSPLQEAVASVFRPIGSFFGNVLQAGSLAERVRTLEEQNAKLQAELQDVVSTRSELEELQSILQISEVEQLEVTGARVVSEAASNFELAVLIDKGASDGIVEDMPVIAAQGLVGRVTEVYAASAKVMLIIDPESKVSARLSASKVHGLIEGQREDPLRFGLATPDAEIIPGEPVETSGYQLDAGFEGLFPPGIPIGNVELVEPSDDGLSINVLVRPNVDFSRLDVVGIVTGVERAAPDASPEPAPGEDEES